MESLLPLLFGIVSRFELLLSLARTSYGRQATEHHLSCPHFFLPITSLQLVSSLLLLFPFSVCLWIVAADDEDVGDGYDYSHTEHTASPVPFRWCAQPYLYQPWWSVDVWSNKTRAATKIKGLSFLLFLFLSHFLKLNEKDVWKEEEKLFPLLSFPLAIKDSNRTAFFACLLSISSHQRHHHHLLLLHHHTRFFLLFLFSCAWHSSRRPFPLHTDFCPHCVYGVEFEPFARLTICSFLCTLSQSCCLYFQAS